MAGPDDKVDLENPDTSDGKDKDDKPEKTYTEDQVQAKLRGQGKQLEELNAKLAKLDEAEVKRKETADKAKREKLVTDGKTTELLAMEMKAKTDLEASLKERDDKIERMQQRETERLETVAKDVKARLKALPENLRDLVPSGLDVEGQAAQLVKLEAMNGTSSTVNVAGGPARSGNHQNLKDKTDQLGKDFIFKKKGGSK